MILHTIFSDHYKQVAQFYDSFFERQYDDLAEMSIREFTLKSSDRLVDLGAGTGGVTHIIWKKAGPQKKKVTKDQLQFSFRIILSK